MQFYLVVEKLLGKVQSAAMRLFVLESGILNLSANMFAL